jgi:hypothetical protein
LPRRSLSDQSLPRAKQLLGSVLAEKEPLGSVLAESKTTSRISPCREQKQLLGSVLAKKEPLGSVLAESKKKLLGGSDLTLGFCRFFKRQGENPKEKQEGNGGGVRFNPQVLQVSRFSEGDKDRVSLDMEFPLFKQASDKGIGG